MRRTVTACRAFSFGLSAASAPAGPGGVEALAGALDDQLALELVNRAEDMEDQPPSRRGRVDVLLRTTRPTPHSSASARRCLSDRIARDSRVMTNTSPWRRWPRALSSSGRAASWPDALSMRILSHPKAVRSSTWLSSFWLRVPLGARDVAGQPVCQLAGVGDRAHPEARCSRTWLR
jgi:hypothetical protein